MNLEEIFQDKTIRQRVTAIGEWLLNGSLPVEEFRASADQQKAVHKTPN